MCSSDLVDGFQREGNKIEPDLVGKGLQQVLAQHDGFGTAEAALEITEQHHLHRSAGFPQVWQPLGIQPGNIGLKRILADVINRCPLNLLPVLRNIKNLILGRLPRDAVNTDFQETRDLGRPRVGDIHLDLWPP